MELVDMPESLEMTLYEVCSTNTRTENIKNVLYLEITCLDPFQSTLFPNAHTYPNGVSTP